jgi:branched-chain amino acid transport system ATP-binding protein
MDALRDASDGAHHGASRAFPVELGKAPYGRNMVDSIHFMLQLRNMSAGYGKAAVLDRIDLSVGKGEVVAVLGPNGAGKSTLIKAIAGVIERAGELRLDGKDISRFDSHRIVASGLAVVPEGRHIFAPFSVADNLRLGAIRLPKSRSTLAERFEYVYGLFPRLAERRDQAGGTLSGGEQQMLAVGRALMSDPRILLLDEPFLGLAPLIVEEILSALQALRGEGLTLVLVEQKTDIALHLAQRAYVLVKGRVVMEDTSENLLRRGDLEDLYFAVD